MSETILIWLFGIIGAWLLAITGLVFNLRDCQKRLSLAVELFVEGIGKGAAIALHSPDDHLGFDYYCDEYLARHYELTSREWEELKTKCDEIVASDTVTNREKGIAAMLSAVCQHKLSCTPYTRPANRQGSIET